MTKNARITPDKSLSATDPGDDTQRRYRYQAVYAAIICLDLLDEESEFEEIFCELHEDTLVKKKDGTFIGIQVKTRVPGRELFKSNDKSVIKSLKRFVELSVEYPNHFSRFVLATNYAFWSEEKKSSNLRYLLKLAKEAVETNSNQLTRPLPGYIKKLIKKIDLGPNVSVTSDMILNVLCRVELQDDLPKFDDVESRLANQILSFYDVGEAGYDDLLRATKALINKMFEAAALQHVSAKQMYFALYSDPAQARTDAIIDGKRITKQSVEDILTESLFGNTLLSTKNKIEVADLPQGITTLALKMAAGKVSARNIRRIIDFKYSAQILINRWIYKSPRKANRHYKQLMLIVGNECEEAYDLVQTENKPFGQEMLNEVRQRLRRRLANDPHLFFGCEYEHLLGIVAILTEQCEVWWSEEFTIPGDTR
ncbi:MAG: dsDNA nuclease domain-containing protein [Ardenticatenaceae bacterium]